MQLGKKSSPAAPHIPPTFLEVFTHTHSGKALMSAFCGLCSFLCVWLAGCASTGARLGVLGCFCFQASLGSRWPVVPV